MDHSKASKGFIVFLLFAVSVCAAKQVTVKAAWRNNTDSVYLICDDEILEIFKGELQPRSVPHCKLLLSKDMDIRASYHTFKDSKILYYTNTNGFQTHLNSNRTKSFKYGPKRPFVKDGEVDAAARLGDEVYFFKGCQMAIRHKWFQWGKPKDMQKIGLPCNVDAAWKECDNRMVLLRGDEIWTWYANGTVDGPKLFKDSYTMGLWELAPDKMTRCNDNQLIV